MAWTTQPYCLLSDVKALLDPNMGTQDDTFLSGLIIQAQADLDSEIGYSFQQDGSISTPAVRFYDGTGLYELWTDDIISLAATGGVIETSTVTYLNPMLNAWVPGSSYTIDITADIILKPNNYASLGIPANKMVRNSGYHFTEGVQNYKVSGIFGRPILSNQTYPGVPNDVSRACMRLVVYYYKMRDTAYADMIQEQGNVRIHYTKEWPMDVKRVVAKYQHVRFLTRVR